MNLSVGAKTDPGRRPNNEDQLLVLDVRRLGLRADGVLVIADGMGGRNFGERASAAAVETVGTTLTEMLDTDRNPSVDVGDALDSALRKANARVYELGGQDEQSKGMGTTCVAAVVEGNQVHVAHVGDSRAYLCRKGQMERLTDDHSYVAEQVRAGVLSEESAARSRFRNVITRAVGIEPTISPDVAQYDLHGGETLLLCTDGLSNMVPEEEIGRTLTQASSAQDAADRLVHLANLNGGRDNITAIVARLEVGNRTQRMRTRDLARIVQPSVDEEPKAGPKATVETQHNGSEQPRERAEDETPTVQPARAPRAQVEDALAYAAAPTQEASRPRRHRGPRRGVAVGLALLGLLAACSLAAALVFGRLLEHAGYNLQPEPPFAVKPPPPAPPKPPDLAHVGYDPPTLLSVVPLRGDVLTLGGADGSVCVVSLSGQVLRLTPDGRTLFKYALPARYGGGTAPSGIAALPAPSGIAALPAPSPSPAGLFFATDPQGNLYISDPIAHAVKKFRPDGDYLSTVAAGQLKQPQALAAGADGTVFILDAQRLKVIRARSAAPR